MSLLAAAASGSTSECRLLLEAGGDVGEKDKNGKTPLLFAAYFGLSSNPCTKDPRI